MNCCDYDCNQGRNCPVRSTSYDTINKVDSDLPQVRLTKCQQIIKNLREKLFDEYSSGLDSPPE